VTRPIRKLNAVDGIFTKVELAKKGQRGFCRVRTNETERL